MTKKLLLPCVLLAAVPVAAQVSVDVDTGRNRTPTTRQHSGPDGGQDHHATAKAEPLRASELIGHTVVNGEEESIGSVEDLVLNRNDGSIQYVAVSMGGFLGVGDKLFAVPYEKIECRVQDGQRVLTLNIPTAQLKNAKGFDQANWPDMASRQWRDTNDRAYGVGEGAAGRRPTGR